MGWLELSRQCLVKRRKKQIWLNAFFSLPFPSENKIQNGTYKNYVRYRSIVKDTEHFLWRQRALWSVYFKDILLFLSSESRKFAVLFTNENAKARRRRKSHFYKHCTYRTNMLAICYSWNFVCVLLCFPKSLLSSFFYWKLTHIPNQMEFSHSAFFGAFTDTYIHEVLFSQALERDAIKK